MNNRKHAPWPSHQGFTGTQVGDGNKKMGVGLGSKAEKK